MAVAEQEHGARLEELHAEVQLASAALHSAHEREIEGYRRDITEGITQALARLQGDVLEASAHNRLCAEFIAQAKQYVEWLQWTLWDVPYFAVAVRPPHGYFRRAVAACGLVYLSIRVFDDVIDRHFWYKGKHPTLLSATSTAYPQAQGAEGLTILAGLLLCFEGLATLASAETEELRCLLLPVLRGVRGAVMGAILEHSEEDTWDAAYYDRLVELKNVDYWRCLYAAVDPEHSSPLYPFLEGYYALAQQLNDVQDFPEDERRGQPNLVSCYLGRNSDGIGAATRRDDSAVRVVPWQIECVVAEKFIELGAIARELPHTERLIAQFKLAESLQMALEYGLFRTARVEAEPVHRSEAPRRLHWYAEIDEVIVQAGGDCLEWVDCAVCGSSDRRYLFRKQGFAYHRCAQCSHVYVSPRINTEVQQRVGDEPEGMDLDDAFLSAQKMFALPICQLLRARAAGSRLLDIGFGHGYLMHAAQALGFQTYGIDTSAGYVERLTPHFHERVAVAALDADDLPFASFDVVVLSHVLEHFAEPAMALHTIRRSLNNDGLLYIAVPDIASLQFRMFGKRWDAINPLVHLQNFNEQSLSYLLKASGFTDLERVQHPPMAPIATPRWLRLLRRLGGTDAGELAMLARLKEGT